MGRNKNSRTDERKRRLYAEKGRKAGGIIALAVVLIVSFAVLYISNGGLDFTDGFSFSMPRPGDDPYTVHTSGRCTVNVIDVGQGDSTLISIGNSRFVLIDTGPESAEDDLGVYLDSLGIEKLDYLVLTHPHEDHIGGADMVLEKYDVGSVLMPEVTSDTMTFASLLDAIDRSSASVEVVSSGDTFSAGDLNMTVLSPIGSYEEGNEWSIVLRADFGEVSMLFTGDAEAINENELLHKYGESVLNCDYLKAGHHGSSTSSSDDFIRVVSPKIATISCAEDNKYGHPDAVTLDVLSKYGAEVYRTDELGSIVLICDGKTIVKSGN